MVTILRVYSKKLITSSAAVVVKRIEYVRPLPQKGKITVNSYRGLPVGSVLIAAKAI